MYLPRHFAETDLAALDELVARNAFATLITVKDGIPEANHLPVLYRRTDRQVCFRGHWSRANPQWKTAAEQQVLLIIHGPHAYISPSTYPDKEEAARVPTWNYAVAHIHGPVQLIGDTDGLAAIVSELSSRHEAAIGADWRYEPAREDHRNQLRGIVGFALTAERIELKFKLNQNHPAANVLGAAAELERRAAPVKNDNQLIARWMRDRLARRKSEPAA